MGETEDMEYYKQKLLTNCICQYSILYYYSIYTSIIYLLVYITVYINYFLESSAGSYKHSYPILT